MRVCVGFLVFWLGFLPCCPHFDCYYLCDGVQKLNYQSKDCRIKVPLVMQPISAKHFTVKGMLSPRGMYCARATTTPVQELVHSCAPGNLLGHNIHLSFIHMCCKLGKEVAGWKQTWPWAVKPDRTTNLLPQSHICSEEEEDDFPIQSLLAGLLPLLLTDVQPSFISRAAWALQEGS